jgi:hypothetical protein
VFVCSSHGRWVFPPLLWSPSGSPLSQTFTLLVAGCVLPMPPSPAMPGLFIYSSRRIPLPPSMFRAPHPLSYVHL